MNSRETYCFPAIHIAQIIYSDYRIRLAMSLQHIIHLTCSCFLVVTFEFNYIEESSTVDREIFADKIFCLLNFCKVLFSLVRLLDK